MGVLSFFSIGFCLHFGFIKFSAAVDSISQSQSISEGRTLTSKNGIFELGFFSPSDSTDSFLGIWHKKIPVRKFVWVANQNNPINDSSGILTINTTGNNALLLGQNNSVFWSTNSSKQARKPLLQLLDSGNLVLRDEKDENPENYLWQSFKNDYKMGAFLTGMRLNQVLSAMADSCDDFDHCGPNGLCDVRYSPVCSCPKGFKPKSPQQWSTGEFRQGCERNEPLNCQQSNGFIEYFSFKLEKTQNSLVEKSMNAEDCREKCLKNCSCVAYASSDDNGGGCCIWFDELIGIRHLLDGGQSLYIRSPASELDKKHGNKVKIIAVIIVAASASIIFGILLAVYYKRRKMTNFKENDGNDETRNEDLDIPLFNVSTVTTATENFSSNNKLGQGGFGSVYKGTLPDGEAIAVKKLSQSSGQGVNEFKNEVILIAKLQHRNLVRLLGYGIQGEERLLVYEYMPNKSLDYYIFDQTQSKVLDWPKRFNIILGIARGLIYLHQDSRLRIIHRDLKASNVLLDRDMNPKISDFGMARTFRGDQTEGVTNRVVGTFGYMAPEYAIDGQFSVKSDVFSFGILMLEIVSGKRNRGFYNPSDNINLIGHAWKLWKEGRPLELIDECLHGNSNTLSEVLRCIHVGLLCVQQLPEDRPTMSSVILMLGDKDSLPQPKEPSFFLGKHSSEANTSSSTKQETSSTNEFSISLLHAPR